MIKTDLEYDVWLDTQIELLKMGNLRELDVANLIEELEDLGRSQKAACRSLVYQIILHKLFCDYWTAERERNLGHWEAEIIAFQFQLNDHLTTNIRNHLEDELHKIYLKVLKAALAKATLSLDPNPTIVGSMKMKTMVAFPNSCPYTLDQIIGE